VDPPYLLISGGTSTITTSVAVSLITLRLQGGRPHTTANVMNKAKGEQFVALDVTARRRTEAAATGMGTREQVSAKGDPKGDRKGGPKGGPYEGTDGCLTVAQASIGNLPPEYLKLLLNPNRTRPAPHARRCWYGIGCRLRVSPACQ